MRVGVCGTHSVGKTSLLQKLTEEIKNKIPTAPDLYIIHELARREARDCGYDIRSGNASQVGHFQQVVMWKQMFEESLHQDGFVSDRTIFDMLAYRDYYQNAFVVESGWLLGKQSISRYMADSEVLRTKRYDFLVYLPIEFDEVPDEARGANYNLSTTDDAFRLDIDRRIKSLVEENPQVYGTLITATGSVEKRVDMITSAIKFATTFFDDGEANASILSAL
jgi:hypothetical protein